LSQWGTVDLAEQGYVPYDILVYYYGNDIELVRNAPVQAPTQSYPGFPIALGYIGEDVRTLQIQLNRIARNYPAIPKIADINSSYDYNTQAAVLAFQEIFNLSPTGTVDEATWYRIAYIYTSVKHLAELDSEGIAQEEFPQQYAEDVHIGMQGQTVRAIQYYLAMVGAYYVSVQSVPITGYFGSQTEQSVKSFQKTYGLPETGVVDRATWYDLYRAYMGIIDSLPEPTEESEEIVPFPGVLLQEGVTSPYVRILQTYLTYIGQSYPEIGSVRATGYFGPVTRAAVQTFQRLFGLTETGSVGVTTWNDITSVYSDLKYGYEKQPYQNPGYVIS
jgi:peptidoglycan hydrolase-like protein with peptidoglycan-binding domain